MFYDNKRKIAKTIILASAATLSIAPSVTVANSTNVIDRVLAVGNDFDSDEMPGVLSYVLIKEDDVNFTTGDSFRIAMPSGVKWKMNHYTPRTVFNGTNGASLTVIHVNEHDLELMITGNWDLGKNSVQIPLYFEIDGAKGDVQLRIDPRNSTLTGGSYTFATVPDDAIVAEIRTDSIPTIPISQPYDEQKSYETATISLKEGTTGIWSRSKLQITFPTWIRVVGYEISNVEGLSESSEQQLKENIDQAIESATNTLQFQVPPSTFNEKRGFTLQFHIIPKENAEGEITAQLTWAGLTSKTIVVGNIVSTDLNDAIVFTIGEKFYMQQGAQKEMDMAPFVEADRVYLPIRYVAEAVGIDDNHIKWDPATRQVSIQQGNKTLALSIGSNIIKINEEERQVDVAPKIINSRTFLPLRAIAEALDAQVDWNETEETITIHQS